MRNSRRVVCLRCLGSVLLILTLMIAAAGAPPAAETALNGEGTLKVMTYNMYAGTNFTEVLSAPDFGAFLAAVTATIQNVRATDPAGRAAAIAHQIALARPHLVSLQEVATWSSGPSPAALQVEFDDLQLLLDALAAEGASYTPVAAVTHFDFTAPSASGDYVRSTLRVAILARNDLKAEDFSLTNVQAAPFATNLVVPFPALGTNVTFPRVWISTDVTYRDKQFRFIATHLEAVDPAIEVAQGNELLAGPANTTLPVVLAADMNANAGDPTDPTHQTYTSFLQAGFLDAWAAANPYDPGPTCCQSPTVNNALSLLDQRVDLVLARGRFRSQAAVLFGEEGADTTAGGLWPSDHAGLAARLQFPSQE